METSDGRLQGKLAVVTGATRGIGRAIARELVAAGARVVGTGTRADGALPPVCEAFLAVDFSGNVQRGIGAFCTRGRTRLWPFSSFGNAAMQTMVPRFGLATKPHPRGHHGHATGFHCTRFGSVCGTLFKAGLAPRPSSAHGVHSLPWSSNGHLRPEAREPTAEP